MVCPVADPVPQLDNAKHESTNCGPACGCRMLAHATCNAVTVKPEAFRARIPNVGAGGTSLSQLKQAMATFAPEAAAAGYNAPNLVRLGEVTMPKVLRAGVLRKNMLILGLDYKVLQEPRWRDTYSGADYTGGHWVTAQGIWRLRNDGTMYRRVRPRYIERVIERLTENPTLYQRFFMQVGDPVADGRWSFGLGQRVPQATQMWPLDLVLRASQAFSNGRGVMGVVARAGEI